MTEINWSRPLVTNAGKPARVVDGPDDYGVRYVEGDFGDDYEDKWHFNPNGGWIHSPRKDRRIRNATPAEVLTHPDVWPEWQDWANNQLLNNRDWPAYYAELERREPEGVYVTREIAEAALDQALRRCDVGESILPHFLDALGIPPVAAPQPEGVYVTREALFAAIVSVGGLHGKPMYALADALGFPPAPPKLAPWEAAYEAWDKPLNNTGWDGWAAAVEWFVGQIEAHKARCDDDDDKATCEAIRRRIMGNEGE
jgi:hypothetical protein